MQELPWLTVRAAESPDAPALHLPDARLSWDELAQEVKGLAAWLARSGVAPGDIVATLLGSADFARWVHAIWLCGATVLPLNLRLRSAEIGFQLRDAGACALLHGSTELEARARDAIAELPGCRRLRAADAAAAPGFEAVPLDRKAPAAVLYTSGTTGQPKGAVLTAENFEASARASEQHLGSSPEDRCLACMPLFHVGGLSILVRSVLLGSSVHVQEGFDPAAVNRALDGEAITDVSFVANMLARVLDDRGPRRAPASLRTVLVGGGPLPAPLLQRAAERGWPVAPTYGLTEATSQVATRAPGDPGRGARPLPGVELRIDSADASAGGEGEILVRGPNVMQGYLGRPDETARALRDGWLHTGDIGRLHRDGTLQVLDRRRDLIVSGGENVYPAEIESVLTGHPGVAEAGVAGRPDARFGARPVAWIVAEPGQEPEESELIAFCRERLAAFKVPVACRRVEALPRTSSGKLVRARLGEGDT